MTELATSFEVALPAWLRTSARSSPSRIAERARRMAFVLALAERNVREQSGGPFAAAVFERDTGELVSVGVNVVVASGQSLAHAEVVALALAERSLGTFELGDRDLELVTSAEPCVLCLGAVHWSGVRALVIGARDEDVRAIGFDEGPKPADWIAEFARRGVHVERDVEREDACRVLALYVDLGGPLYNATA
ncbi:MAG: nucleoside deaminase [Planctomycetes bacterium]|nr:nucleoside deaminase [Planctomycetota bacterium]